MTHWVIAYDIGADRLRSRARRLIRPIADSYQLSVFEVRTSESSVTALCASIAMDLEPRDALLAIPVRPRTSWWTLGAPVRRTSDELILFI